MHNIYPSWPHFTDEESDAVRDVIASNKVNYWTGQIGREFEREFATWANSNHAIALANGTLALDLALKALGIGVHNKIAEDEVIVTPRSFIASVSSVVNAGATPVFADVDHDSGNLSAETIAPKITTATKAIILVHLGGWPADMPAIMRLAKAHDIAVIEDCAQAHGAAINGQSVGSFGQIGAWSFCQDKIMTTGGEGGMVTTQDADLWKFMWSYKDHGKDWDAVYNRQHPPGFRFVHDSFGTNWRMLEMQSVIGRVQLQRMADWRARRTKNAAMIAQALAPFGAMIRTPKPDDGFEHAYYRYYAYIRPETQINRDALVAKLREKNIPVMHGTCSEIYLEKAFDNTPWRPKTRLPIAKELGETSVMFMVHPTLLDDDMEKICASITEVMESMQ